jgi:eukaryotic-like serine/threonine-protein kinase
MDPMTGKSGRDIEVFTEAVQLPIADRAAFLDRACAGDEDLRRRIEALLRSNDRAGAFLEQPPEVVGEGRIKAAGGEKPGDRVGRYKLLQQIGEGGYGVVFMAEQEEPVRRRVALKIIKPGMDTKGVIARFEAERQALALMDHRNIAKIFDAGATDSGRPYFVMELVRGIKITEYCDQHSLATEERLKLFVQVCQAIQHAHQKGIIHRDIKPSNIMVTATLEGAILPIVIDFGIAKATTNQRLTDKTLFTAFEMLIGTPAYMSPEQAVLTSVDVDTRTDIYSLGVLLYELLTGSTPFDTEGLLKAGLDEIRRVIREQEPVRPSTRLSRLTVADLTTVAQHRKSEPPTLIRAVRGDLDWIVMKALEKDRTRRYETANGLAMDIQSFLANEAISARPPSKLYRLQKLVLRNKILYAGVGVIALLLIVSLIAVSISLAKERRSRREAEAASTKSQQVTKFLEEMLQGVGPSVALGEDTKLLRRILDQTVGRVGKEMADQPEVEAELRNIIGGLYGELGYPGQGEKMVRQALAIHQKEFGSESLEAAASLNLLGRQLMGQYKRPEAARAHGEALAIRRRLLGQEHADTATSLSDLAAVYGEEGNVAEAEAMAREALRISRKVGGNNSSQVADVLRNLCMILGNGGKWAEAEETAREVLKMRRNLHGPEHPSVAAALHDLAWAVNALEKFEEAETLEAEAVQMQERLLGGSHPDVAITLNSLGKLLGNRGDKQASEGVLKAVLSIQRKMLAGDHPATLETLGSLANVLQEEGKRPEAESTWREALAIWDKRGEIDKPERLYALRGLGESLESQGKWSQAQEVWQESLVLWRKRGGIEERQSMFTLRKLGLALEAARNWPEAESVYREALTISRKKGDEDPEALVDLERVVRVLTAEKKFVEAQQLLDKMLTPAFVAKPASVSLLVLRVNVMGRRGRWREAAGDAALALENQLTEHYRYHTLAALLAMAGDRPAYEQVCKRLVTKFADSTNPYVSERIAQDYLLLPNSGADLALMDKLADKAVTAGSGTEDLPYFQACKAMSQYRLGNFSEAIAWGEKSAKSSTGFARAKAYAILAMAHSQLGQRNEALVAVGNGDALAPAFSPEKGADDLGESWVAWVMARVSLDEATKLIQAGSTLKDNSNPP